MFDKLPCFLPAAAQLYRQTKIADAVHDAEVDRLGPAPHLLGHLVQRHTEDLAGRPGVHILIFPEGLQHQGILCHMSQNTQLNLRVIAGHEPVITGRGNKQCPDLPTDIRTGGDILQIGVRAGQAPRHRHRLLEMGMDPPRGPVDQGFQPFQIGGLELGQHPVLQNGFYQRMFIPQFFQHFHVGGIPCFRLFDHRQSQLFKQNYPKLFGRIGIEARIFRLQSGKLFQTQNIFRHLPAHGIQFCFVHADPGQFQLCQHPGQRQFHLFI